MERDELFVPQKRSNKILFWVSLIMLVTGYCIGSKSNRELYEPRTQTDLDYSKDHYKNMARELQQENFAIRYDLAQSYILLDSLRIDYNIYRKKTDDLLESLKNIKNDDLIIKPEEDPQSYVQKILNDIPDKKVKSYVKDHYKLALLEQDKFKFPASVKLAQAMIETGYGSSELARYHKNHFGIKYFKSRVHKIKQWDELVDLNNLATITDDKPNEKFLAFHGTWHTYRYHSLFVAGEGSHYLKYVPENADYKDWCAALRKGGYATAQTYERDLIRIIETNGLYKLDNIKL